MKKVSFLLPFLFLASACSLSHHTVSIGEITITKKPRVGKHIKVKYRIDSMTMADKKNLQLTLYYTLQGNIYAVPVKYLSRGEKIKASFVLPDTAEAFALKDQVKYVAVNRENGYVSPVYNRAGKPVAGALAGTSLFYNNIGNTYTVWQNEDIDNSLLSRPVDEDTALKLMQEDFAAHPEIKHAWMKTYLNTLLDARKEMAYADIESNLQQMLASDSVKTGDYATAYNLYVNMDLWNKADSVMKAGTKRFPRGALAMQTAKDRFYSFRESRDSMLVQYQNFIQEFPSSGMLNTSGKIQDEMMATIAAGYADSGHYKLFLSYLSKMTNLESKARTYNFWGQTFIRKHIALPLADSLEKTSLALIEEAINTPEKLKQSYQTDEDWKREMQHLYSRYADNYASFLDNEGRLDEAIAYQSQAVKYQNGQDPFMNERYLDYLMKKKDYATARKMLEQFIISGYSTDKSDSYLKPLYLHFHHSQNGYAAYYQNLEDHVEARLAYAVKRKMINEPAPDFTLTDLNGRPASLAALKGKVIVLDFWATWCGPCKASLPGLQQVDNHFKTDSNVVILLVNTLENTKGEIRHKEVSGFITQNNYTLRVLMDQPKPGDSTKYKTALDYQIPAIPARIVIDPDGHIRFKTIGFFGSTSDEAKKTTLMIEMARR